jgi:hypothetical protein
LACALAFEEPRTLPNVIRHSQRYTPCGRNPANTLGTATFGTIRTTASNARIAQLAISWSTDENVFGSPAALFTRRLRRRLAGGVKLPPRPAWQACVPLSRPGQEDLTFWLNHNGLEQLDALGEVGRIRTSRLIMPR